LLGDLKIVQIKKTRKRGFFIVHERGLAALILKSSALKINKRNISNTQNKKASSFILSLLCFNFFVDLFVTQRGFEPPTVRAEI
tara:strand:+ start:336 stop:587 length:252 start_codon:yes stop_codon:yes gene_type:complete